MGDTLPDFDLPDLLPPLTAPDRPAPAGLPGDPALPTPKGVMPPRASGVPQDAFRPLGGPEALPDLPDSSEGQPEAAKGVWRSQGPYHPPAPVPEEARRERRELEDLALEEPAGYAFQAGPHDLTGHDSQGREGGADLGADHQLPAGPPPDRLGRLSDALEGLIRHLASPQPAAPAPAPRLDVGGSTFDR